ncbi:MAG: S8 family serine peptidase [bacterium]|nr:S8 family serine peptidase [bacterium]
MKLRHVGVCCLFLLFAHSVLAGPADRWAGIDYLSGRLLVVLDESAGDRVPALSDVGIVEIGIAELDQRFNEFECTSMRRLVSDAILDQVATAGLDIYRTYILTFRPEYPVMIVLESFSVSDFIKEVEPDIIYRSDRTPNDPQFSSQWDKQIMGAPAVWDISTGSPSIICAGLDTGVDWRHPDLSPALWVNPGEDVDGDQEPFTETDYPGDLDDLNGADDDGNGYVDDFLGWDFISGIGGCAGNEDCDNVQDNDMFGRESHGTHVGGIMCAAGDNGQGVAGFSWVGRLMALRCGYLSSDMQGYMPQSATIPGTYYAIANGADIINMSYGGPGASGPAQTATEAAWDAGLLLFGASGNDNLSSVQYPAGYADVIAVNATNSTDHKANFSNYGSWTDISAPGVQIPSTVINGGYQSWDGTSMASPNAAGAAALLWSLFPDFANSSIRDLMFMSATNLDALNPNYVGLLGAGRVDVETAASMLLPNVTLTLGQFTESNGDGDHHLESGETGNILVSLTNNPLWAPATNLQIECTSSDPLVTVNNPVQTLGGLAPSQTLTISVELTASSVSEAFWLTLNFDLSSDEGFHRTISSAMRVGRGPVLVIDDDGSLDFQSYYYEALIDLGMNPDLWDSALDGEASAFELSHYAGVFWVCGNEATNTLSATEQAALTEYLNNGGKLLISGQGLRNYIGGSNFFADYLHASSDADLAGDRVVRGVTTNPVFGSFSLLLQGGQCANNGMAGPDRVTPVNGGTAAFEYTNVGGTGAVMYDGAYKVLYFAFALEAACGLAGTQHYSTVLSSTLDWWQIEDAEHESRPELPSSSRLLGNYPNPFNPETVIQFEMNARAMVQLNVYDVQGRLVSELLSGVVEPGVHSVRFDGSALSSGVYFARMAANGTSHSSKMILLK